MPDINDLIKQAKGLRELDACSVWIIVSMALGLVVAWQMKQMTNNNKKAAEVRASEAQGMILQATALQSLARDIVAIKTILTERSSNAEKSA